MVSFFCQQLIHIHVSVCALYIHIYLCVRMWVWVYKVAANITTKQTKQLLAALNCYMKQICYLNNFQSLGIRPTLLCNSLLEYSLYLILREGNVEETKQKPLLMFIITELEPCCQFQFKVSIWILEKEFNSEGTILFSKNNYLSIIFVSSEVFVQSD